MSVSDTARALNDALDTELGRIDRSNSNSEGRSDQDPALGSDDLARRPRSPTQHGPLDLDVAAAAARNSTTFGQQSSIVAADASVPSAGAPLGPGSPLSPGTDHQEHCVSSRHSTPIAQRYPASELPPKPASSRSSSRPSELHEPRHGQGSSSQGQGSGRKPPQHPSSAARSSNSSEEAAGAGFDRRSAARDEPIPSVDEILAQLSSASRSITLTGAARSAQENATAASSSDQQKNRDEKNATRKTTSESTEGGEPRSKHTKGSGFDVGESAKDRERSRTRSPSNHGRGRRFSSETSDTSSPSPESSPPSRDATPGRTHGRYHIDHPRPSDQKSSARSERRQREKDSRRPDHSSRDPRGEARDIVDEYRDRYPQLEKGTKHQSSASRPPSQYESGRFDRELQRGYELERARHETPRGQRQRDRHHRDVEDRDRASDPPRDRPSPRTKRYYASPDTDEPSSSDAPPVQLSPRMSSRKAAAQTAQNRTQEILAAAGVTLSPRDYQHSREANPSFAPGTPHGSVASPGRTITGLSSIEGTATKQPFDSAPRSSRAAQRRRDQDASTIGVSGIGVVPAALSGSLASMHIAQQSRDSSSSPSRDRGLLSRSGAAAGVPPLRDSKLFRSTSAMSNGSSHAAVSPRAVAVDGLLSARSQQRQVATPGLALALTNGDGADCVTPPPRGPMVPGDVTTHPRPGSATRLGLGRSPRSVSAQKRRTSEERQHPNPRSGSSGAMVPSTSRSASAHRSASQRNGNAGNGLYETADAMLAVRQAQDEVHELRQALLQATQEVHGARQDASLAQQQLASSETEKAELTERLEAAATELAQRNHHIVKLESDHAAREAVLAVQSNASAQLERKLDDQRWAHDNETGKLQQDLRGAAVKIEELLRENHALRKARDALDAKCVQLAREADSSRAFFEKPLKAFMQAANPVLTVSKAHRDDRLLTDYARQIAPAADPSTSRDRPDRTFSSDSDSSSGWERRSGKRSSRRDKYGRDDDRDARRGGDRSYERLSHRGERGSDSARRGHRSSRHGRQVSHSSRGSSRDEAIDWRPSTSRPGRDASDDERRHRSSPPPHRSRSYAMCEASKPQRWPLALAATPETDALGVHSHLQLRSARRRSPSPDLW